ncbi:MAG: hypothetical protein NT051_02845, partial [Candidatus Micrarchaeota archaeon]|nr:hypothetical protein [Candidatus Micrarchaeota archaeon]
MGDHKHKTKGVLLSDIEKKIDRIRINEFGFVGVSTRVFPLTENAASAKVSGSISPYVWSMELGINNKWTPEKDTYIKEFLQERSAAEKGIMVVGGDTGRHEFGHPGFCPKSLDSYTRILDATTVELDSMGIKSKSTAKYLANCFMDLIDNANVRGMGQGDGLTIFYYIQGDSGFYSSFIALNMLAWGQEADRKLIGRKFEQNFSDKELAAVQKPANEYAAQIGLGKLDNTGNFAEKSDAEKLDTLNNDSGWEEYARLFARKFGNMVKHKEPQKDDGKDQSGNDSKQDGEKGESESGEKDNDKKKEKDPDGKGKKENEKGEKKDGEKEGGEEKDSDVDDGPEEPGKHMGKKAEKSKNKASGKSETDETDEPDSGPGENPFDREISTPE